MNQNAQTNEQNPSKTHKQSNETHNPELISEIAVNFYKKYLHPPTLLLLGVCWKPSRHLSQLR